jgi:hypothetical protein
MLVRLSIIGAVAAILMFPTTLSAQGVGGHCYPRRCPVSPGGAVTPGAAPLVPAVPLTPALPLTPAVPSDPGGGR